MISDQSKNLIQKSKKTVFTLTTIVTSLIFGHNAMSANVTNTNDLDLFKNDYLGFFVDDYIPSDLGLEHDPNNLEMLTIPDNGEPINDSDDFKKTPQDTLKYISNTISSNQGNIVLAVPENAEINYIKQGGKISNRYALNLKIDKNSFQKIGGKTYFVLNPNVQLNGNSHANIGVNLIHKSNVKSAASATVYNNSDQILVPVDGDIIKNMNLGKVKIQVYHTDDSGDIVASYNIWKSSKKDPSITNPKSITISNVVDKNVVDNIATLSQSIVDDDKGGISNSDILKEKYSDLIKNSNSDTTLKIVIKSLDHYDSDSLLRLDDYLADLCDPWRVQGKRADDENNTFIIIRNSYLNNAKQSSFPAESTYQGDVMKLAFMAYESFNKLPPIQRVKRYNSSLNLNFISSLGKVLKDLEPYLDESLNFNEDNMHDLLVIAQEYSDLGNVFVPFKKNKDAVTRYQKSNIAGIYTKIKKKTDNPRKQNKMMQAATGRIYTDKDMKTVDNITTNEYLPWFKRLYRALKPGHGTKKPSAWRD